MTTELFITNKAHHLAKRYNNVQMYEDLKQEALLVGYEMLAVGITDENKIGSAMRTRAHDFYNFGLMPVYVPPSGYSRRARLSLVGGDHSQVPEWPLLCALLASRGGDSLEEGQIHSNTNHVLEYEYKDFLQNVMLVMDNSLDNREYFVVTSIYLQEVDQQTVAYDLGISQQRVAQVLEKALEKIRVKLGAVETKLS
jgi:RNA polymerase sigma factor (sigma-70 family)